jgi:hypothetical protein
MIKKIEKLNKINAFALGRKQTIKTEKLLNEKI